MRNIALAIVHCSATRPDWMNGHTTIEKVAEIRRWHVEERGWADIGYNWVIDRDGTIAVGRDRDKDGDTFEEIGAHTKGKNTVSLGICLLGGHGSSATDAFSDHFTEEQEASLKSLLAQIEEKVGEIDVAGHNDFAAKACPGFKVDRWLNEEPPARTSIAQSTTIQASAVVKVASAATPVVGMVAKMPWQTVAVLGVFALVAFAATGVIDLERLKKWRGGDT